MIHAPSNGQPASQVRTNTTVVLQAPDNELRLERERGLNCFYLPQNSSSSEKLHFLSLLNCTKDDLLHKISLSKSEDQPFSGCTNWRSDSFSAFFLSSHFLILSSRSNVLHLPRIHLFAISQKVMGGPLIFISILFGCPDIFHSYALQRGLWNNAVPDWDPNPRFQFLMPRT